MELRCPSGKLFGRLAGPGSGVLIVRCRSRWCGYVSGILIEHHFDLTTAQTTETKTYKDPNRGELL